MDSKKTRKAALTPQMVDHATRLGVAIRKARLGRGYSQADFADRGRMSLMTLKRIEEGDTRVRFAHWLSALDVGNLLHLLNQAEDPAADARGAAQRALEERKRAGGRRAPAEENDFDF